MKDSGNIRNDLEHPNGRNEGPTVVVGESSKSPLFDYVIVGVGEEQQYTTRERQPLGEWWKNHILSKGGEEWANVIMCENPLSWREAIRNNMWKFLGNVRTSLYRVEELRNSIVLQVFDYSQSGSC